MTKKILILGGLGNGSVVAHAIEHSWRHGNLEWKCAGFLNDGTPKNELIDTFPVFGNLSEIPVFLDEGYFFINTIMRIDGQKERLDMFARMGIPEDRLATFIHPTAYVAGSVQIGVGSVIMPQACISSGTKLGRSNIIMVGATVGHDNIIGDFCHVAAQACVGAYLKIGYGVHIGLNATIREHVTIGDYATIGMGAVLTKSVGEREIWAGNPAKFLRFAE